MEVIQISERQKKIIEIVKENEPITSEVIASHLGVTRATLRPDLSILTMSGILDARPKVGYFYSGGNEGVLIAKQMKNKKIREVMSVPVVVPDSSTIHETIITMFLEDVGTIFITSNGGLSGIVSRKDLLKNAIGGGDISKIPVGVAMTRMPNVIVAYPEDSVLEAVRKILEHEVDSIPVVEVENMGNKEIYKIVGRFSKTNIARLFVEIIGD